MQTFLPYPNFTISALHLDYRRLGKQRVECDQIITAIQTVRELENNWDDVTVGEWNELRFSAAVSQGLRHVPWASHPCTMMWRNNILALMSYRDCCIREWIRRGYENNMPLLLTRDLTDTPRTDYDSPSWLGIEDFHASHRSNLLRKDFEYYNEFNWTEPSDIEYVWPS